MMFRMVLDSGNGTLLAIIGILLADAINAAVLLGIAAEVQCQITVSLSSLKALGFQVQHKG